MGLLVNPNPSTHLSSLDQGRSLSRSLVEDRLLTPLKQRASRTFDEGSLSSDHLLGLESSDEAGLKLIIQSVRDLQSLCLLSIWRIVVVGGAADRLVYLDSTHQSSPLLPLQPSRPLDIGDQFCRTEGWIEFLEHLSLRLSQLLEDMMVSEEVLTHLYDLASIQPPDTAAPSYRSLRFSSTPHSTSSTPPSSTLSSSRDPSHIPLPTGTFSVPVSALRRPSTDSTGPLPLPLVLDLPSSRRPSGSRSSLNTPKKYVSVPPSPSINRIPSEYFFHGSRTPLPPPLRSQSHTPMSSSRGRGLMGGGGTGIVSGGDTEWFQRYIKDRAEEPQRFLSPLETQEVLLYSFSALLQSLVISNAKIRAVLSEEKMWTAITRVMSILCPAQKTTSILNPSSFSGSQPPVDPVNSSASLSLSLSTSISMSVNSLKGLFTRSKATPLPLVQPTPSSASVISSDPHSSKPPLLPRVQAQSQGGPKGLSAKMRRFESDGTASRQRHSIEDSFTSLVESQVRAQEIHSKKLIRKYGGTRFGLGEEAWLLLLRTRESVWATADLLGLKERDDLEVDFSKMGLEGLEVGRKLPFQDSDVVSEPDEPSSPIESSEVSLDPLPPSSLRVPSLKLTIEVPDSNLLPTQSASPKGWRKKRA